MGESYAWHLMHTKPANKTSYRKTQYNVLRDLQVNQVISGIKQTRLKRNSRVQLTEFNFLKNDAKQCDGKKLISATIKTTHVITNSMCSYPAWEKLWENIQQLYDYLRIIKPLRESHPISTMFN